ncbi:hypothetical protein [Roseivirga spongicola]|uniref:hypothetical protein n=1 Tax=Roseivirga spongicola TaxID=333140 RepID=UPI002AC9D479|nr:hypothetical protein [Roseivirga spongicola]WPZ09011.1 hypothetical protein T7867_12160 [Roseivirga spongicola]
MTNILLVEDREILRTLFSDLIENYWPDEKPLSINTCGFESAEKLISEKEYQIYVFNISTNSASNFSLVKQLVQKGHCNKSKIIITSVDKPPTITTDQEVEIHYCNEDNFTAECLPLMVQ